MRETKYLLTMNDDRVEALKKLIKINQIELEAARMKHGIRKVIFNDPATIILWNDGSKTVVKRTIGEMNDPYAAFCAAVTKKIFGNNSRIKKLLKTISNYEEVNDRTMGRRKEG